MLPPSSSSHFSSPRDTIASQQLLLALLRGMDDLRHQLAIFAEKTATRPASSADPTTRPTEAPDHPENPDIRFWYYAAK